ncbi:MAG: hypothetical protein IJQ12_07020 [Lachnospiraceae bacterium]|nr:hypothetical protein [Lachnospiraceae bacterium]
MNDIAVGYLEQLEKIDRRRDSDLQFLEHMKEAVDMALDAEDMYAFLLVSKLFDSPDGKRILADNCEPLRLYYLMDAVQKEEAAGYPLFIRGVSSYDELMDRYIACDLYLRRIELGITPGAEEATGFLRAQQISPYAVHAVLYHPTSYLGHREQILLRLAEDALTGRQYRTAYDYLSVIEEASAGTLALKEKLGALIGRGAG